MMPRLSSSDSRATLPRRERPVKTAALSLRSEAGSPNVFEAVRKTLTTSRALTVRKQVEARPMREWSSSRFRISTGVPSASCQGVESSCQVSLGSLATKRMNESAVACGVVQ